MNAVRLRSVQMLARPHKCSKYIFSRVLRIDKILFVELFSSFLHLSPSHGLVAIDIILAQTHFATAADGAPCKPYLPPYLNDITLLNPLIVPVLMPSLSNLWVMCFIFVILTSPTPLTVVMNHSGTVR